MSKYKGDHMMASFTEEARKPEMFIGKDGEYHIIMPLQKPVHTHKCEECPDEIKSKCNANIVIVPCIYGYVDMIPK